MMSTSMREFFENLSVTATQEWQNLFPDFYSGKPSTSSDKLEVVLCTSSEIFPVVNCRLYTTSVYVVYPNHPLIDARYATEFYLVPVWEAADVEDFWLMFRIALVVAEARNISVILLTPDNFSFQVPDQTSGSQALIDYFMENITLPENFLSLIPVEKIMALEKFASSSPFNSLIGGEDKTLGIIACGNVSNILNELSRLPYPVLKLKHYPLGRELTESIYYQCDEILVLEQGLPYIEQRLRGIMGIGTRIRGKINRIVPRDEKISLSVITNILNL